MRKLLILSLGLLLCLASLTATAAENDLYSVLQAGRTASGSLNAAADAAYTGSDPASSADSALAGTGAAASSDSIYYFIYSYNNGSGDYYLGYVYAPTGLVSSGSYLYNQPDLMGGASLGSGYYYIYSASDGYDSSYDGQEYITSYYDGDTGKTSYTLYSSTGQTSATHFLYIDRRYTEESGYVYDPSVPSGDAYFGNSDVSYYFSTSYNSGANFLVTYITDLRYWDQPDAYPGSCVEVTAAQVLSYWDKNGYDNLITTNWQSEWPDGTANTWSYVSLIGTLAGLMSYDGSGTPIENIAPGLTDYAKNQGYSGFVANYYDIYDYPSQRSSYWSKFTSALYAGRPVETIIYWDNGNTGHAVTARGYWNDGHIVGNMGWGTSYTNVKLDWNNTDWSSSSYASAEITDFVDFYHY